MSFSGIPDPLPPSRDSPPGSSSHPLVAYLDTLAHLSASPEASEGSYYPPLKRLIEHLGAERGIRVLVLPRPDENGAPDLRVTDHGSRLVGYVEVKRPGTDLDQAAETEQLRRYRAGYPNLLLTDSRQLRLFRHGEQIVQAHIAREWDSSDLDLAARALAQQAASTDAGDESLRRVLTAFFAFQAPALRSARRLAEDLARKAHLLRHSVRRLLEEDKVDDEGLDRDREPSPAQELRWIRHETQRALVPDLPPDRFADLYAQTVTYGLLAARYWFEPARGAREDETASELHRKPLFTRESALSGIPASVGLVRRLFRWMLLADLPEEVRWILDDLAQVLAASDLRGLFDRYYRDGKGNDPVLHFYETFLEAYDSEKRERRGVYYTPPEVVSYIVGSVSEILRRDFGLEDRLAHPDVTLLDPAAGTLTFLVEAVRQATDQLGEALGPSARSTLKDELLRRFHAFELMVAPYVIGHLRIGLLLDELGCELEGSESFPLLLADALQMEPPEQLGDPDMALLAHDALAALEIKKEVPKLPVVLGNPPYSGHSANRSPWIDRSLREGYERPDGSRDDGYYTVEGRPLGEKNPKWLQDDYVKFLRFAQWKVDQAGQGIVALVTNHSYLDNPTFRGLRESLLGTFDRLYLLDLHGNAKKKEGRAGGEPEQNVFDIQQGVAIALLVKKPGLEPGVLHHEVWGAAETKRQWLAGHTVLDTPWEPLDPGPPGFYFIPRDRPLEERWQSFPAVDEMFEVGSIGVITGRDKLVLDLDERKLRTRMSTFRNPLSIEGARSVAHRKKIRETKTWSLETAWREASRDEHLSQRIERFLFRPFDRRWIAYAPYLLERPRPEVMHHLGGENPARRTGSHQTPGNCALLVTRQAKRHPGAFVSQDLTGHKVLDTYDGNYVFPLYLLPPQSLLPAEQQREPNFRARFVRSLETLYGARIEPEALFGYLYAVLHSETYIDTYRELLATGFPRIPFPSSFDQFHEMALRGWKLVQLHLPDPAAVHTEEVERRTGLEAVERPTQVAKVDGGGSEQQFLGESRQVAGRYLPDEEKVILNEKGLFLADVARPIWQARVGSYRVLARWIDARRGRRLTSDDLRELDWILGALQATLVLREEIDGLYREVAAQPAVLPTAAPADRPPPVR